MSESSIRRQEIDAFIEAQRTRCLWFMREGFRPADDAERSVALDAILQRGDRAAFIRASEYKRWLSPDSNRMSAGS